MPLAKRSTAPGVAYQQMQTYETGANRMSATTIFRLSRALGYDLTRLFDGIEVEVAGQDDDAFGPAEPDSSEANSTHISELP